MTDVIDGEDVGVVQRGGRPRLLLEAPQPVGVGTQPGRQDFDRDVATEPRVARPIDLPHPARANERDDLVGAESNAGREGHGY